MHEVYKALGQAPMMFKKANPQKASKAKRDKSSPNFTRKAQKCNDGQCIRKMEQSPTQKVESWKGKLLKVEVGSWKLEFENLKFKI